MASLGNDKDISLEQEAEDVRLDPVLIARIFSTISLETPQETRITKKTLELVSEYIRLYATEAILRSNEARLEEKKKNDGLYPTTHGQAEKDDLLQEGLLDAVHLKEVAGLLNLDF
ncbi:unnamed protein product [Ambrosiozyma monospora]|uniref:Unnamed protein product n=1 Tax=Ambrosiozyma monospora TaxID=43982 RepID=A0A9W6WJU1_AMBMO|nr:unnamed protein product [Ambrosiozyma monospora]